MRKAVKANGVISFRKALFSIGVYTLSSCIKASAPVYDDMIVWKVERGKKKRRMKSQMEKGSVAILLYFGLKPRHVLLLSLLLCVYHNIYSPENHRNAIIECGHETHKWPIRENKSQMPLPNSTVKKTHRRINRGASERASERHIDICALRTLIRDMTI